MQEFIVLGQIPGTEFQLSFTAWLYLVLALSLLTLVHLLWREVSVRWHIHTAETHTDYIFHTMHYYRQY